MRILSDYELTLVAGGCDSSDCDEDIVVTGQRLRYTLADLAWYAGVYAGTPGEGGGGGTGEPTEPPPPPDEASIDVEVKLERPLTDSEKAAVENLKASIAAITQAINALPDNAILRLPNGADVTGAELKDLWARTDFIINDNDVAYRNNSYLGEADMPGGDPTISFNIGALDQYDNLVGGMNYLVAHELGHLSQWGTSYVYDQVTANDIARALLDGADLPYLENPQDGGYTPGAPTEFSVTDTGGGSGDDTGGDGGGGGGGWDGYTHIP